MNNLNHSNHAVSKYEIRLPKHKRVGEPWSTTASPQRVLGCRNALCQQRQLTRCISALATEVSDLHPHVFKLQIRPSRVASFIASGIGLLPGFARSWVKTNFPEWFIRDEVVLKKQKAHDDEEIAREYFDTEVMAYCRLTPFQGVVIPRLYGCVQYEGTRAMMIQYLGGISLSSPEGATLSLEELSKLLQPCYQALHAFGVHQDDGNLSNFQLADGKLMVLDLESAVFHYSADDRAFFMASSIQHLAGAYLEMQAYYRHEGSLEAA